MKESSGPEDLYKWYQITSNRIFDDLRCYGMVQHGE